MEWISVNDERKPRNGDIVLVMSNGQKMYASYDPDLGFFFCDVSNILLHAVYKNLPEFYSRIDIEWWYPQPEPPK